MNTLQKMQHKTWFPIEELSIKSIFRNNHQRNVLNELDVSSKVNRIYNVLTVQRALFQNFLLEPLKCCGCIKSVVMNTGSFPR